MAQVVQIGMLEGPIDAVYSQASSEDSDFPHQNLFADSSLWWQSDGALTESTITFDFGYGNTKSIDYAALQGLNLLLGQNVTDGSVAIYIEGSDDNFDTSATIFSDTDVQVGDLTGSGNADYLFTGSASTAYRYIRLRIVTGASIVHIFRSFGIGTRFDFGGRSPVAGYGASFNSPSRGAVSDSGSIFKTSMGKRRRVHTFTWNGISDSVRNDFETKIHQWVDDFPVFIYGPTGETHDPLGGRELLFGWITEPKIQMGQWNVDHKIGMNFIESIS